MDEMTNEVVVSEGKKSRGGLIVGIVLGIGLLVAGGIGLAKHSKSKKAAQNETNQD